MQENETNGLGEVKQEKDVDNNESSLEGKEYFEETNVKAVMKSENDLNILNKKIAALLQWEKAAKEKGLPSSKRRKTLLTRYYMKLYIVLYPNLFTRRIG